MRACQLAVRRDLGGGQPAAVDADVVDLRMKRLSPAAIDADHELRVARWNLSLCVVGEQLDAVEVAAHHRAIVGECDVLEVARNTAHHKRSATDTRGVSKLERVSQRVQIELE